MLQTSYSNLHHAGDENVIVCVLDMQFDLTNQNAIDMAKEADPGGRRTLGVLTKPDNPDAIPTAPEQVSSGNFQMGLGFVVVWYRSCIDMYTEKY